MFINTKTILKIVFLNTNFIILPPNLAISRFNLFICIVKRIGMSGGLKKIAAAFWHPLRMRLSTFKLVSGVVVALFMSFVLYFFSCAMLEAFRLMTVTPEYDMWVLGDKERSFYQLFFAFVSAILAQSFCLVYWFDGPRKAFERGHRSAVQIVNSQRNLNWYFLSWFAKIILIWFCVLNFPGAFYAFSLYPDFKHLFILIVIVLFLHPWVAMRLAFKRKTLKWMALSAVLVTVLAFGMSRINVVDYESLESVFLSRNVPHVYGLELPGAEALEKVEHATLSQNVYLVQSKDEMGSKCLIVVDGRTVDSKALSESMEEWRSCHSEADIPLLTCRLNIDKKVRMREVEEVLQTLADMRFYRIRFAAVPKHRELDVRYYDFLSLPAMRMPIRFLGDSIYQKWVEGVGEIPNQIVVMSLGSETYDINGALVEGADCKSVFKDLIQQNLDYVIRLKVDEEMLYGDYVAVMASALEALDELKDEYAMEKYLKHWDQVYLYEEEKEIHDHFPFRFFEESDMAIQQ